ncbi:MAG: 8-oxoguanine deaminase [Acidimicrobiales bacterium]
MLGALRLCFGANIEAVIVPNADLLIRGSTLVATVDDARREIPGGWVSVRDGYVDAVGGPGSEPPAERVLRADGCLVTPGLINTHHHIFQNLTRAYRPATSSNLFGWLTALYPIWSRLDEEAAYVSAWIGLAELALGGATTSTDHLYVHPRGGGDLISAEIRAAQELGMRFHPTRGSMSLSQKDGGLPPDSVVQADDEILADSERLVERHHDPAFGAMIRIALAPCSPFSVTPALMRATAELAERLDVRLHTHLAEDADEDRYCLEVYGRRPLEQFEEVGWATDRAWVAHCICPNPDEVLRMGRWGTGVAHCPSSNMILGGGLAPVTDLRAAGVPVGLGCDGSASADSASLWLEARTAMLLGRLRGGAAAMQARDALDIATRGGAACLGRAGELGQIAAGLPADLAVWPLEGIAFAGALSDPIEAWLRCGPVAARHTIVHGRPVVEDGRLTAPGVEEMLARHRRLATALQR